MALLHALFSELDALCISGGLYKVETIGDCYMTAAGLFVEPEGAVPHLAPVAATLLFALRAQDAAARHGLQLRAGLHSGPVTAGLVGTVCVKGKGKGGGGRSKCSLSKTNGGRMFLCDPR